MANKGFNLKVREVENGFTIHVTRVGDRSGGTRPDGSSGEEHFDYIAEGTEIKTKLGTICDDEVDELRGDRLPEKFR